MKKRGQAAMEFLMTYVWAILVVLAAIVAMAYVGMSSSSKYFVDTCQFSPGLSCLDVSLSTDDIVFVIQNNLGTSISVINATLLRDGQLICSGDVLLDLKDGQREPVSINCSMGASGSKFKGELALVYQKNTLNRTAYGSVIGVIGK